MDQLFHFLNLDTSRPATCWWWRRCVVLEGLLFLRQRGGGWRWWCAGCRASRQGRALRYGWSAPMSPDHRSARRLVDHQPVVPEDARRRLPAVVGISHLIRGRLRRHRPDGSTPPAERAAAAVAEFRSGARWCWSSSPTWRFRWIRFAAAVGLSSKLWVLILGSMMAVLVMRFVARVSCCCCAAIRGWRPRRSSRVVSGSSWCWSSPLTSSAWSSRSRRSVATSSRDGAGPFPYLGSEVPHVLAIKRRGGWRSRSANASRTTRITTRRRRRWNLHGRLLHPHR